MSGKLLVNRLSDFLNREVTVAVGEELITGTLTAINMEFITLVESTDNYERESRTRIIVTSQISFIQVAETQVA